MAIVSGLNEVLRNFDKIKKDSERKRKQAFIRIGAIVKADSVKNTPVDTGNLRSSAFIKAAKDKVSIGYTAAYAFVVHEDLEAHHEVGEAKYLERAVTRNKPRILQELADSVL